MPKARRIVPSDWLPVPSFVTVNLRMCDAYSDAECLKRVRDIRERVLSLRASRAEEAERCDQTIPEFYRGRHVFVTGGSGFIGRVVVEKLLRACPDVGNVYLLLRPRHSKTLEQRLHHMLDVPMFDRLRAEHPGALDKLVPVSGDCSELGLGLSDDTRKLLQSQVSVVIHSAASVRFNEPLKKALLLNTRGAREVVELAKGMDRLAALVHISTAYTFTNHNPTLERVYSTALDWKLAVRMAEILEPAEALDYLGHKILDFQPNTYAFSKALAECLMAEAAETLPVVIVRPSIVTASVREPLPGWVDNLNGIAAFTVGTLKGVLRVVPVTRWEGTMDIIPADMASQAIIVASWAKGIGKTIRDQASSNVDVVTVSLGDLKPTSFNTLNQVGFDLIKEKAIAYPGAVRAPMIWKTSPTLTKFLALFYHILFAIVLDTLCVLVNQKPRLMLVYRRLAITWPAIEYFITRDFNFGTVNYWRMQAMLNPRDLKEFDFDVEKECDHSKVGIDQVMGILKYTLKEYDPLKVEAAKKHYAMLWWAEVGVHIILCVAFVWWFLK